MYLSINLHQYQEKWEKNITRAIKCTHEWSPLYDYSSSRAVQTKTENRKLLLATSSTRALLIPIDNTEDLSSYLDFLVRTMRGGTKKHGKNRVLRSHREGSIGDVILKNGSNNGSVVYESCLSQVQDVFELDAECNVILQGLIGQGFYGEVYKGAIERENSKEEPQLVAIKKLKTRSMDAGQRDFEREISIMKVTYGKIKQYFFLRVHYLDLSKNVCFYSY